jgi:hypothetical protein
MVGTAVSADLLHSPPPTTTLWMHAVGAGALKSCGAPRDIPSGTESQQLLFSSISVVYLRRSYGYGPPLPLCHSAMPPSLFQ